VVKDINTKDDFLVLRVDISDVGTHNAQIKGLAIR
jgi:hypothetical protein